MDRQHVAVPFGGGEALPCVHRVIGRMRAVVDIDDALAVVSSESVGVERDGALVLRDRFHARSADYPNCGIGDRENADDTGIPARRRCSRHRRCQPACTTASLMGRYGVVTGFIAGTALNAVLVVEGPPTHRRNQPAQTRECQRTGAVIADDRHIR